MNFEGSPPEPEFDEEFIVEYFRREIEQAFSNASAGIFQNVKELAAQHKESAERRREAEIGDLSEPAHTSTFGKTGAGKSVMSSSWWTGH